MKRNIATYIFVSLVALLFFAYTSPIKSNINDIETADADSNLSSKLILSNDKNESAILDTDADKASNLAFDISANDLQSTSLSDILEGNNMSEICCRRDAPTVAIDAPTVAIDAPTVAIDAPTVAIDAPTVAIDAHTVAIDAHTVAIDADIVAIGADIVLSVNLLGATRGEGQLGTAVYPDLVFRIDILDVV
ncbi:hypothetical protein AYI70_g2089 [Smittium culicis]|uniref:Uncharacterized protein n=1 Tax=Smittium culicis TaxID=133412 RepID=A0A1R1YAL0_9FUNG|nr:hypothetical protein AYI70_g2089 [Smittium culicis]